jgi:hypothetical protein
MSLPLFSIFEIVYYSNLISLYLFCFNRLKKRFLIFISAFEIKMYKLDLPIDLREQSAIERRRRLEKERQARIFNNKHRLIGVCIIFISIYHYSIIKCE